MSAADRARASLPTGLTTVVALVALARAGAAHVDYVAPDAGPRDPAPFLRQALTDPLNVALLAGGALAVGGAMAAWLRWGDRVPDVRVLEATLERYSTFVPWMLRLSLGLPLVGAGFSGFLFTPLIDTSLRVPLVAIGFLLLLGLATRLAALAGLATWIGAGIVHGAPLLLTGEYVGGFLAILLLGPGRPSADHMLESLAADAGTIYHRLDPVHRWAKRFREPITHLRAYAPVLVRVPLGATFVYLGIAEKLLDPGPALALAQELGLAGLLGLPAGTWVLGAGLVEAAVGLLLVLGLFPRATSTTAFLVLTVTLMALPNDPVLPHITLFGLTSVVFTLGAGPWSLDALLRREG